MKDLSSENVIYPTLNNSIDKTILNAILEANRLGLNGKKIADAYIDSSASSDGIIKFILL